jgi:lipopolysaccharide transport system permease protein
MPIPHPQSSNVVTYTSKSWLRQSSSPFRLMWRDLLASRSLARQLLIRDISAQYRQSFLGLFWAFLPAITTAIGFTIAADSKVLNIGKTDIPYPAYILISMTLWQTFLAALNSPMQAVASGKAIMSRINFPREALVLAKLGDVFFNFGIKLIPVVILFIWLKIPITWSILLAPVALIHLVMLGTAIGLFLAPISGLYQDISKALTIITGLWLFITPVVYPLPKSGVFRTIVQLNPVTPLLVTTRELATTGIISNPQGFWIVSVIAAVGLLLAWMIYRVAMPYVVERASS